MLRKAYNRVLRSFPTLSSRMIWLTVKPKTFIDKSIYNNPKFFKTNVAHESTNKTALQFMKYRAEFPWLKQRIILLTGKTRKTIISDIKNWNNSDIRLQANVPQSRGKHSSWSSKITTGQVTATSSKGFSSLLHDKFHDGSSTVICSANMILSSNAVIP